MAKANLVEKKSRLGHRDIIKFQILTHCFLNDIPLSDNGLDCLTLLAAYGTHDLAEFCNIAVEEKIFKTAQTVRNFLTQAMNLGLVLKNGTNKKTVGVKEELQIMTNGNIVLNYTFGYAAQKQ